MTVGPDSSNLKAFPDIEDGKAVVLTATLASYDQKAFPFDGTMTTDPRIHLRAVNPVTVKAMSYNIDESNDPTQSDILSTRQLDYYGASDGNQTNATE